jgi:hypothetical protein
MNDLTGGYYPEHCRFGKIYKNWIEILSEFAKQRRTLNRDWPWWSYNERASLSMFAGAIWLAGGCCVEEYAADKKMERKATVGRVDLYFSWRKQEFIAEAKKTHRYLTHRVERANEKLGRHLNKALADMRLSPNGQRRLGILFVKLIIQKGVGRDEIDKKLQAFVSNLKKLNSKKLNLISYAWVFPEIARVAHSPDNLYPGEVVLIAEVK